MLLEIEHRAPGGEDFLLERMIAARSVRRVKVEIRQADHVAGHGAAIVRRERLVDDDEAALDVLDLEIVGHAVDQRLQRNPLVGDGALFRSSVMSSCVETQPPSGMGWWRI